eukprot:gene32647-17664_t
MQWSVVSIKTLPTGALQEHHIPQAAAQAVVEAKAKAEGAGGAAPPLSKALAPIAGHTITAWREALIILGGHAK